MGTKKPLARKRISVQKPFSHSISKLEQKISRRKTTRFFAPLPVSVWPKSLLQFDLTSKIMKIWEQIIKKERPNTIQIDWIVKNQEKANNSLS